MNATSLYVSTCRMVMQAEPEKRETWSELYKLLPYLRQSLSCSVCFNLLSDPYSPTETSCQHHVCRNCLGGKKRLKPNCSWCRDYSSYVDNVQIKLVLQCYRKLCEYIKFTPIYSKLCSIYNNGGQVSLQDMIDEAIGENHESVKCNTEDNDSKENITLLPHNSSGVSSGVSSGESETIINSSAVINQQTWPSPANSPNHFSGFHTPVSLQPISPVQSISSPHHAVPSQMQSISPMPCHSTMQNISSPLHASSPMQCMSSPSQTIGTQMHLPVSTALSYQAMHSQTHLPHQTIASQLQTMPMQNLQNPIHSMSSTMQTIPVPLQSMTVPLHAMSSHMQSMTTSFPTMVTFTQPLHTMSAAVQTMSTQMQMMTSSLQNQSSMLHSMSPSPALLQASTQAGLLSSQPMSIASANPTVPVQQQPVVLTPPVSLSPSTPSLSPAAGPPSSSTVQTPTLNAISASTPQTSSHLTIQQHPHLAAASHLPALATPHIAAPATMLGLSAPTAGHLIPITSAAVAMSSTVKTSIPSSAIQSSHSYSQHMPSIGNAQSSIPQTGSTHPSMMPGTIFSSTNTNKQNVKEAAFSKQNTNVNNGSSMYSVMYADGDSTKITIKRKPPETESNTIKVKEETVIPPVQEIKKPKPKPKPKPKRKGCRCGNATPTPGKLTCCGQRCPCYVEAKACIECRCRGCRNPHRPGGKKVRPIIPQLANIQIHQVQQIHGRNTTSSTSSASANHTIINPITSNSVVNIPSGSSVTTVSSNLPQRIQAVQAMHAVQAVHGVGTVQTMPGGMHSMHQLISIGGASMMQTGPPGFHIGMQHHTVAGITVKPVSLLSSVPSQLLMNDDPSTSSGTSENSDVDIDT